MIPISFGYILRIDKEIGRKDMTNTSVSRSDVVLQCVQKSIIGVDAYQVAKQTGLSVQEAGRTLNELWRVRLVFSFEDKGTQNDLARCFVPLQVAYEILKDR